MTNHHETFLNAASALVGKKYVLAGSDAAQYEMDWRGRYRGTALSVILPASADEVASVVKLCARSNVSVVPQAGNTGLTGGAVPPDGLDSIILNVSRLNRIREIDILNNTLTAEAGCILATVRSIADEHDRLFPMLLGSVGSCEIGGLVSTNAGGTGVIRYGNMRELVLGLEVVLADGRKWDGLRALRKDNSGYDLKQLFIGAEGTLGIVTAAVLKLHPKPVSTATAMVSLRSVDDAVGLLQHVQGTIGNRIEAFEIMSKSQLEIVLRHSSQLSPFAVNEPWYVMMEIADNSITWNLIESIETALEAALEKQLIVDAVVATDNAKAERIWSLRHTISESNKREGFTVSNDTSVPISRLPEFIRRVERRLSERFNDAHICHCGHVGDGNIHVIIVFPRNLYRDELACEAAASEANTIVHEESVLLGGSISAEHGIGKMHLDRLPKYKSAIELDLMRSLKTALDPRNIMNPIKVLRLPN